MRGGKKEEVIRGTFQYRSELFAYILAAVRNFNEAEDILQDAYLVVCEKWDDFETGSNLRAWIWGIVRIHLKRYFGNAKRHVRLETLELVEHELMKHFDADRAEEEKEALRICINELPARARTALVSYYLEGCSSRASAERVGVRKVSLYKLLSRAREVLATCIKRRLGQYRTA